MAKATLLITSPPEACDRCGYSEIGTKEKLHFKSVPRYKVSSSHLANALYEIVIAKPGEDEPAGCLYFCGHHYRKYEVFIASQGYGVHEWEM